MRRIVTFGCGHHHGIPRKSLNKCYSIVEGERLDVITQIVQRKREGRWCTTYPDEEFAGVERWGLTRILWDEVEPQYGDTGDTRNIIYVFNNGGSPGWYNGVALAEDGTHLAGHISSDDQWMAHDMGITSDWKHEQYDKHYGAHNWKLEWVPQDEVKTHKVLLRAFELNKKKAEESAKQQDK